MSAHDCSVGNSVIFSNNVMLAGHVHGRATSPSSAAAPPCIQFARVGAHSFLGGMSGLENDLIPYGMALGNRAAPVGAQHRRPAAARLLARRHPQPAPRLPAAVRRRGHAGGARSRTSRRSSRTTRSSRRSWPSSGAGGKRALCVPHRRGVSRRRPRRLAQRSALDGPRMPPSHDRHRHPGRRRPAAADDRRERGARAADSVHIVAIEGEADPEIARFPHTWVNWGQVGRMVATLRAEGATELVIAGGVRRPDLWQHPARCRLLHQPAADRAACWRAATIPCSRAWCASSRRKGLTVRGAHEVAPDLLAGAGPHGRAWRCRAQDRADAELGFAVRAALGPLDAGQAVVVARRQGAGHRGRGGHRCDAASGSPACPAARLPGPAAACWPRAPSPARSCASTCRRSARARSSRRQLRAWPASWSRRAPCWCSTAPRPSAPPTPWAAPSMACEPARSPAGVPADCRRAGRVIGRCRPSRARCRRHRDGARGRVGTGPVGHRRGRGGRAPLHPGDRGGRGSAGHARAYGDAAAVGCALAQGGRPGTSCRGRAHGGGRARGAPRQARRRSVRAWPWSAPRTRSRPYEEAARAGGRPRPLPGAVRGIMRGIAARRTDCP